MAEPAMLEVKAAAKHAMADHISQAEGFSASNSKEHLSPTTLAHCLRAPPLRR